MSKKSKAKVLFILKQRPYGPYGSWSYNLDGAPLASGLYISAQQMTKALDELGIDNKLVHVIDNNCIDREVAQYKPTHVIIEAFWVVPEKFKVLKKLHPKVEWIVRNHSKLAFLASEGGMVGWALDYLKLGVTVASNSLEAARDFKILAEATGAKARDSVYLPNYYQLTQEPKSSALVFGWAKLRRSFGHNEGRRKPLSIDVGCFGAVRPMKNHLTQAVAAIEVAESLNAKLRFWINGNRLEGKAEPYINSLRALFERHPQHELKELGWLGHSEFVSVVSFMDVVLQVSCSETFNIVAADAVSQGVPIVGSSEIPWLDKEYCADPGSTKEIASKLLHVWQNSRTSLLQDDQLYGLNKYCWETKQAWREYLG